MILKRWILAALLAVGVPTLAHAHAYDVAIVYDPAGSEARVDSLYQLLIQEMNGFNGRTYTATLVSNATWAGLSLSTVQNTYEAVLFSPTAAVGGPNLTTYTGGIYSIAGLSSVRLYGVGTQSATYLGENVRWNVIPTTHFLNRYYTDSCLMKYISGTDGGHYPLTSASMTGNVTALFRGSSASNVLMASCPRGGTLTDASIAAGNRVVNASLYGNNARREMMAHWIIRRDIQRGVQWCVNDTAWDCFSNRVILVGFGDEMRSAWNEISPDQPVFKSYPNDLTRWGIKSGNKEQSYFLPTGLQKVIPDYTRALVDSTRMLTHVDYFNIQDTISAGGASPDTSFDISAILVPVIKGDSTLVVPAWYHQPTNSFPSIGSWPSYLYSGVAPFPLGISNRYGKTQALADVWGAKDLLRGVDYPTVPFDSHRVSFKALSGTEQINTGIAPLNGPGKLGRGSVVRWRVDQRWMERTIRTGPKGFIIMGIGNHIQTSDPGRPAATIGVEIGMYADRLDRRSAAYSESGLLIYLGGTRDGRMPVGSLQQGIDGTCDFGYGSGSTTNAADTIGKYFDVISPYADCPTAVNTIKTANASAQLLAYISATDQDPTYSASWATSGVWQGTSRRTGWMRDFLSTTYSFTAAKQEKLWLHFYENTRFPDNRTNKENDTLLSIIAPNRINFYTTSTLTFVAGDSIVVGAYAALAEYHRVATVDNANKFITTDATIVNAHAAKERVRHFITIVGANHDSASIVAADSVSRVPNGYGGGGGAYWGGNTYTSPTRLATNYTTPEIRAAFVKYLLLACTTTTDGGTANWFPGKQKPYDGVFLDNVADIGLGFRPLSGGHIVESYNIANGAIASNYANAWNASNTGGAVVMDVTTGSFIASNRTNYDKWTWDNSNKPILQLIKTTMDTLHSPTGKRPVISMNAGFDDPTDHFHDATIAPIDLTLEWGGISNRGQVNASYPRGDGTAGGIQENLTRNAAARALNNRRQQMQRFVLGYAGSPGEDTVSTVNSVPGLQTFYEGWINGFVRHMVTQDPKVTLYDMYDSHAGYFGETQAAGASPFDSLHFGTQGTFNFRYTYAQDWGGPIAQEPTAFATVVENGRSGTVWTRSYSAAPPYSGTWVFIHRERPASGFEFMSNSAPAAVALGSSYQIWGNETYCTTPTASSVSIGPPTTSSKFTAWGNALSTATYSTIYLRAGEGAILFTGSTTGTPPPPVNSPPTITNPGNKSVVEQNLLTFGVSGSDPDGTAGLIMTATGLPTGSLYVDNGAGSGTFSWTPALATAGAYNVTFTISDGALQASTGITITVSAAGGPGGGTGGAVKIRIGYLDNGIMNQWGFLWDGASWRSTETRWSSYDFQEGSFELLVGNWTGDHDVNKDGSVDVGDLTALVTAIFATSPSDIEQFEWVTQ